MCVWAVLDWLQLTHELTVMSTRVYVQITLTAAELMVYTEWTLASGGCHAVCKTVESSERRFGLFGVINIHHIQ